MKGRHALGTAGRAQSLPARLRYSLLLLVAAVFALTSGGLPTAAVATDGTTTTVQWTGNGSENADPGCEDGQTSYWHWILTPGGNNTLVSGTLEVGYESGETTTTTGSFRGNGNGAMHFDVTREGGDKVTSASATFTYEGDGGKFVLTISDSECRGEVTPPPPPPHDECPDMEGNQPPGTDCTPEPPRTCPDGTEWIDKDKDGKVDDGECEKPEPPKTNPPNPPAQPEPPAAPNPPAQPDAPEQPTKPVTPVQPAAPVQPDIPDNPPHAGFVSSGMPFGSLMQLVGLGFLALSLIGAALMRRRRNGGA